MASELTTNEEGDASQVSPLLEQITGLIASVTAVCTSLGKVLAVPEPALGVAGRDGAQR